MNRKSNNVEDEEKNLIREQKVLDAFNDLKIEKEGDREAAWERFSLELAHKDLNTNTKHRKLFFYPVAASFITLISISLLLISHYSRTTYRAARGEISQFHFPDSSVLILNADSKVSFRKYGWDKKRIVSLEGEAFFDVRKGRDFYIETSEATVKVLGTTFNVYSRDGFFSVKCKTGEILVISKIYESADTLKNKEAVDIDIDKHKGIKKYLIADNNAASWINGEFNYNDAPLAEVLKEFERQFNLKVSASAIIQSRHYSGYFRNDSLIQALEYICTPMNLNYQISKGNIIHIY